MCEARRSYHPNGCPGYFVNYHYCAQRLFPLYHNHFLYNPYSRERSVVVFILDTENKAPVACNLTPGKEGWGFLCACSAQKSPPFFPKRGSLASQFELKDTF